MFSEELVLWTHLTPMPWHAAPAWSALVAGVLQSDATAEKSRGGWWCETNVFFSGHAMLCSLMETPLAPFELSVWPSFPFKVTGGGSWVGWRWQGWILSAALCPCRVGPVPKWSHDSLPLGGPLEGEIALPGLCPVWHIWAHVEEAVFRLTVGPLVLYVLSALFWLNMKPKQRISESFFHFPLLFSRCKLVLLGGHLASVLSSWFPRDREGRDEN